MSLQLLEEPLGLVCKVSSDRHFCSNCLLASIWACCDISPNICWSICVSNMKYLLPGVDESLSCSYWQLTKILSSTHGLHIVDGQKELFLIIYEINCCNLNQLKCRSLLYKLLSPLRLTMMSAELRIVQIMYGFSKLKNSYFRCWHVALKTTFKICHNSVSTYKFRRWVVCILSIA